MSDDILMFFLLLAAVTALALALRALRHWQGERAGRVYELPVDRRGVALRTGAAGVAALVAATLAVPLLHRSASPPSSVASVATPPPAVRTASAVPVQPPPPPSHLPAPAPPEPSPSPEQPARTLGHPSGGTLQLLGDGTRVWLPPFYDTPHAAGVAFPVVLAHVEGPQGDPDLYAGLAAGLRSKRSDPFLLVMPDRCDRDSAAVLAEVAHRYRTLTSVTARAVLGIGPQAPCAVREALANPDRFRAGIGISGTYPPLTAPAGPYPPLLLASAAGESGPHASALRLRRALHARGDAVRLLDGTGKRAALMGLVGAYLTEKLDGAARVAGEAGAAEGSPVRAHAARRLSGHVRAEDVAGDVRARDVTGHVRGHVAAHVRPQRHAHLPARPVTHAPASAAPRKPARAHVPTHAPTHGLTPARERTPAPVRPPAPSHAPAPTGTPKGHA
ncbi:hypothetical protein ACFO3J_30460 [Streptomyces polygonati]|uniref:Alpha/beta hydrolase n=1 Tax=Streptomyces polygonati TaxID=1617087 RepID=A0ABV8HXL7_9ACTN